MMILIHHVRQNKKIKEDNKKESINSTATEEDKSQEFNKLINKDFIEYRKSYNKANINIWWPSKVTYTGKIFYVMTKKIDLCIKIKMI